MEFLAWLTLRRHRRRLSFSSAHVPPVSAFRSAITRLRSRTGIASTSRVRFGSFAEMIACAASISLCHSACRNTSQRSTCTHCDRGNSTEGDTPSRSSSSAYRSGPAAYVITPFVSFTGFIIANSFPPIDLSAAQNRRYVLHATVSATCGSFNIIARIRSASMVAPKLRASPPPSMRMFSQIPGFTACAEYHKTAGFTRSGYIAIISL